MPISSGRASDGPPTTHDGRPIVLCPAIAFDRIVGGRYKLRILFMLRRGAMRYGEIGRGLARGTMGANVTPRILSRELGELVSLGLTHRKEWPVGPRRVEYSLTDRGHGILPIIERIAEWGRTGVHEEILGLTPVSEALPA